MRGIIIKDWSKIDPNNRGHMRIVAEGMQRFLQVPNQAAVRQAIQAKVQEFATSGDMPTSIFQVLDKFHLTNAYDEGWRRMFDVREFYTEKRNGFDLLDVTSGLTFAKVPLGGKAKVYGFSGVKVRVYFDAYGAGLLWSRQMLDDGEYWLLEDNAIEFRNKAYYNQASNHYALIEAVSSACNVTWQVPLPSGLAVTDATYTANRDIQTMNKAAETILLAVKDKGYGVTAQTAKFIVSCPLQLVPRLAMALKLSLQAYTGSAGYTAYSFEIVPTMHYTATDKYYVVLPGHKLKSGLRMDLTIFNNFESLFFADQSVGWMRYGAAIGDEDQVARCSIA